MGQDFFAYLPPELIMNILSRLPVQATVRCKCVCKLWLDLLVTREFVESHLCKSVQGLVVFELEAVQSRPYKFVEFVDELDLNCNELRWNKVFNFDLPFHPPVRVHSSANGLVFLNRGNFPDVRLFICNPITRDYITLPHNTVISSKSMCGVETYGFGVSRMWGQYKLVRIFPKIQGCTERIRWDEFECLVYTVGTGRWKVIASGRPLKYEYQTAAVFLNGNLHWLATDLNVMDRPSQISCYDLETEVFSTFSPPVDGRNNYMCLSALGDCLCLCCYSIRPLIGHDIDIWLMKEYGDEKSWTKQFIIHKERYCDFVGSPCPIKVFRDGDILLRYGRGWLYYSNKNKTIRKVGVCGLNDNVFCNAAIYIPSFVPLKAFAMEKVTSF